ncbi:Y-family DNA polymerase [Cryobacterium melibiosiphilum]|uniref:Y-family DNA polymerase n=1 Tax=Cryobacterium melibiosiphilum TaxID=995039 RepID=UPI001F15DB2A|nr:Y-family DNA polymerase [Cryobacterium melibiosiphilum]
MSETKAPAPSIAIVDANNFYVSCERIFNPKLEGKPVVVLSNNDGCVIARSQEAKALKIDMAAPWHSISAEATAHGVIARSSNYELYGDLSARTVELLGRYTSSQEVYSIDESFIRLTGTPGEVTATAREIRTAVKKLIGLPVSVGIATSKTLAKLANRGSKTAPALAGVCNLAAYSPEQLTTILTSIEVGQVWGIGARTAQKLIGMGIYSAADLRDADAVRVRSRFGVVQERVLQELRGLDCLPLEELRADKEQIQFSRSFSIPISTVHELREVLSVYTQRAAARLREQGSLARLMRCYASTSPFKEDHVTHAVSLAFPNPTDDPVEMYRAAIAALGPQLQSHRKYVRVGVSLHDFSPSDSHAALDIFDTDPAAFKAGAVLDAITAKYGADTLGLGLGGLRTNRAWTMRRDMVSPRATTHWSELATVHAR